MEVGADKRSRYTLANNLFQATDGRSFEVEFVEDEAAFRAVFERFDHTDGDRGICPGDCFVGQRVRYSLRHSDLMCFCGLWRYTTMCRSARVGRVSASSPRYLFAAACY
jgi:hypothetical protein